MTARIAKSSSRFAQVAALGLVWAIAVGALVTDRLGIGARSTSKQGLSDKPVGAGVVDISRVPLDHCSLRVASFRSRDEGWVADDCGEAFHTIDGGLTFERLPANGHSLAIREDSKYDLAAGHLNSIEWLSDRRALAFGSKEALAMATSDGGVSWHRLELPVPDGEELHTSDHVGQTVWVCGRSGTIVRSSDGGASFAPTKRTPFDNESCVTLSFADASSGWARGGHGTLYATVDGGDTWNKLPVPLGAREPTDAPWFGPRLGDVVRLSAEGWVSIHELGPARRTRTFVMHSFSGEWLERTPPVRIADRLAGGSRWGDDGTVTPWRDDRLIFRVGEQLVRETPLVGAAPPAREIIRGREPLDPGHTVVWTDNAIVETVDDGRSWSTIVTAADLEIHGRPWTPGRDRIWRVVHPMTRMYSPGWQLVELADGTVLTGGREFLLMSTQPEFDRFTMDLIEAQRRGSPKPRGPFECLVTATSGQITFEVIYSGGCRPSKREAELVWTPQGARFKPLYNSTFVTLTNEQKIAFLSTIVDAIHRLDTRHGSNDHFVDLVARCGDEPPLHVELDHSDTLQQGPAYLIEQELIGQTKRAYASGK